MRGLSIVAGGLLAGAGLIVLELAAAGGASAAVPAKPRPMSLKPATTPWAVKRTYVPQGPLFNNPTGNTDQAGSLDLYLKRLIRNTPKGAEIDVALFRLQTTGMANALVDARKRGVNVRIVLDNDSLSKRPENYALLKKNLGTDMSKASWITVCPKNEGCIARTSSSGQWAKNHNKFYVFSKTYDSKNVVVQTSGNATGGMYNQFNDAYTMTDTALHNAYRTYFYDLSRKKADPNYWRTIKSGSRSVSFYPKSSQPDPIVATLQMVTCTPGTKIGLSSGLFTRKGVADQLAWMDAQGCDVRIASGSLGEDVEQVLSRSRAKVRFFRASSSHPAHSKYLLIDGTYGGRQRKLVLTGSHSYTYDALRRNDEAVLTLDDAKTYAAYAANFDKVFKSADGELAVGKLVQPQIVPNGTLDDDNPVPSVGIRSVTPPEERPVPEATLPPLTEQPDDGPTALPTR
ncbi:hypothetical protein BTM25_39630 [Actinomadura rubteroloni]|uniref:phospholipase D n=1 Tax=Actinomadura rubteroloni TaxID=1926885 RepID=A0A2P4UJV1_9ACTN|nr:phospholipase D-like domain-containing protein [Actinomadura rubteroloni]POM25319.1 hypothetical protein BTM25_39630 [Actinomadura rubteroloni]